MWQNIQLPFSLKKQCDAQLTVFKHHRMQRRIKLFLQKINSIPNHSFSSLYNEYKIHCCIENSNIKLYSFVSPIFI